MLVTEMLGRKKGNMFPTQMPMFWALMRSSMLSRYTSTVCPILEPIFQWIEWLVFVISVHSMGTIPSLFLVQRQWPATYSSVWLTDKCGPILLKHKSLFLSCCFLRWFHNINSTQTLYVWTFQDMIINGSFYLSGSILTIFFLVHMPCTYILLVDWWY